MRRAVLFILMLTAMPAGGPARAQEIVELDVDRTAARLGAIEQRLAMQIWRSAASLLNTSTLTVETIELATVLLEEAVALDPDNVELWRVILRAARLAERGELAEEALRRIVALDPADDVVRLQRITAAIERYDEAEQRVAAYARLMDPDLRQDLGAPVVSRLAMDLALLERRRGNMDAFADALAQSVAIDPSNRAAAALAAGFFRTHVDDAPAEAELLVNMLMADPTDLVTQIALAELLLETGAFEGATRLYTLATRTAEASGSPLPGGLLADQTIAQWASGNPEIALRTIRIRQQSVDDARRAAVRNESPELDPLQRIEFTDPVAPLLATVRAVIHAEIGDPAAAESLRRALDASEAVIMPDQGEPPDERTVAEKRLEMAWLAVWLGGDLGEVEAHLHAAEQYEPLADQTRQRFDAWLALRRGAVDEAVDRFLAMPEWDAGAQVGLARACMQVGRIQDAARACLRVARSQPGSILGIWAAHRLTEIVGRSVPLDQEVTRLEEIAASIPSTFDRYPDKPNLAVGLDIEPSKLTYEPYEPLIVNLTVSNNSQYPLAIDRDGPIRPQVILMFQTGLSRSHGVAPLKPVVFDIDRRLSLAPRERLTIPIDLRRFEIGDILATGARAGTFLRVKAILNGEASPMGALRPSLLGLSQWTPTVRIDGYRVDTGWMEQAITDIADPGDPGDLVAMAILSQITDAGLRSDAPPQLFKLLSDSKPRMTEAYAKLDGLSQAWMLGVMPAAPALTRTSTRWERVRGLLPQIRAMAQKSDNRLVRIVYLMFHLTGPEDPMLAAAMRSDDPHIQLIARNTVTMIEERMQEQVETSAQPGG